MNSDSRRGDGQPPDAVSGSSLKEMLTRHAQALGFDSFRVTSAEPLARGSAFRHWLELGRHGEMAYLARNAEKRLEPGRVLPGARSILVLAASYHGSSPSGAPQAGVVARYARHDDYHTVLGERLRQLVEKVDQLGGPETRSLCYVDTGPVLEREIAQRAGAGFVGKHTNLISRDLGNWFFLGEILTTLELEPDRAEPNRCGSCTRCLAACPTQAIVAPFELDARRCISYLTIELKGPIPVEFRSAMGNRIFGCDDCLAACPWNRFAREGRMMRAHRRANLAELDLVPLLSISEAEFKQRFAGTPLLRAKRRGLLRNACVALGNVGTSEALPALERAAEKEEPLVAEHARWAQEQIRRRSTL